MNLDIYNTKERTIVCVDTDDSGCIGVSGNGHLLSVGQKYMLYDIEVHSWHTVVYLKEFPGVEFNSVLFEEVS